MKKLLLYFFAFVVFLVSCKKDHNTNYSDKSCSYIPTNVDHELIYDVDSVSKDDFTHLTDSFHYQIKEVIESIFTDNQGRPTMRLERYKRNTPSNPWIIHKIWSANLTATTYEKKEDNITYIKLVFPAKLNEKWNGNAKNDIEEMDYEYTTLNVPETFNSFNFDSTLTVTQSDFDVSGFEKDYEIEKFATELGVYYKEYFKGEMLGNTYTNFEHYTEKLISYSN
jgi:hypothetical protein